ncbi:MAG: nucleoside-triphosphatase [Chloroflexota bacterium]
MENQQPRWPASLPGHFPYAAKQKNKLFLITGDSGVGKTTWCRELVESARSNGCRVVGLLSPPVVANARKVAIDLVDLATGERRQLARLRQSEASPGSVSTGEWLFDAAVLAWGNEVLRRITAVDLLIIDELGPLEFEKGHGLQTAFPLIEAEHYQLAMVVIRPSLLAQTQQRWPGAQVIPITKEPVP